MLLVGVQLRFKQQIEDNQEHVQRNGVKEMQPHQSGWGSAVGLEVAVSLLVLQLLRS